MSMARMSSAVRDADHHSASHLQPTPTSRVEVCWVDVSWVDVRLGRARLVRRRIVRCARAHTLSRSAVHRKQRQCSWARPAAK